MSSQQSSHCRTSTQGLPRPPSDVQTVAQSQAGHQALPPKEIELRPGLWCSFAELHAKTGMAVDLDCDGTRIDFGFILSGNFTTSFRTKEFRRLVALNRPGTGGVKCLGSHGARVEIAPGETLTLLHINVTPQTLHGLLHGDMKSAPAALRPVLEGSERKPVFHVGPLSPAIIGCAHQMSCRQGRTLAPCLMLEGKALELLAMQLTWLNAADGQGRSGPLLNPRELQAVRDARDRLAADMAAPPNLADLAREVGLGIQKLQAGFQELYGATLYGFLKECRLQKARMLFDAGGMNVSEVAWEIGYTNLSHFSAAFKKRFGVLPKRYSAASRMQRRLLNAAYQPSVSPVN